MNALARHIALRLWVTAIAGGLACLALIPWWQWMVGVQWLALPVCGILVVFFWGVGWSMNRMGMLQIERHAKEAAVWERAGMSREAELALEQAAAVFDSFWLSPLMHRRRSSWMAGRLSRFYLSQPRLSPRGRDRIRAYLQLHPQDQAVAEGWLEHLLSSENDQSQDHELAEQISEAQAENPKVQILLMQFFLYARRADFTALQAYRRAWQQQDEDLPDDLVRVMAGILLNETLLTDWALKVYLRAYKAGASDCLEALAAAVRWITPNAQNRKDLAIAGQIVAATTPDQLDQLVRRFEPQTRRRSKAQAREQIAEAGRVFKAAAQTLGDTGTQMADSLRARTLQFIHRWPQKLIHLKDRLPRLSSGMRRGAAITTVILLAGVLAVFGWRAIDGSVETKTAAPSKVTVKQAPVISDPFTIQVAAYLHTKDADRMVEQLKQHGMEAFWSQATSANRTWYQVKVSHFATKIQAQQFGEQLKAKGLIDDFFVANYKPQGRQ